MLAYIRRHLGWKIFISYLVVILIGAIVLATAAEFVIPRSFDRHLAAMGSMMVDMMGSSMMGMDLNADLFTNFRTAVNEALTIAALAAVISAIVVSIFVSRQVVTPVQEMMVASRYIAAGHYDERVNVPGNLSKDDLDELSQLALSFNQMAEKLEKVESMRRQLIGDVSHELRTPLTAIKGSMEGLMDGVLPENDETYMGIYREADRLQRLVNDLQELSRVEAGAYELDLHPLDLLVVISAVVKRLELQFKEKGVLLEVDVPDDLPSIQADEDRIGQVLLNLVGNALQFTPSGGSVVVSAAQRNKEIKISVSDTGIGISPEDIENIFTRFYRVDKSRSRAGGGSGIGLTISKYLVEAHGGRIWVESAGLDRGSTFTFSLPSAD
ncbi:MAG: cell wall metabolism sensor histidine kinase WalK [candidate division Zixibacteria bacterium]|jgi:histidine kinase|nr:cell wall metabolism sensor histidine kinase WalK [candidate division Zixibacteria bacterium]NIW44641.1 HAMP domain-containing protein [Gammaproteobacteria bacterium]